LGCHSSGEATHLFATMESFDYIVAGAGCAGLSLLYYLLESDLKDSKILLIDPKGNSVPNKTWCYWAEKPFQIHPSQHIHFWNHLSFTSKAQKLTKHLGKLKYYHLNSHDFYSSIYQKLSEFPNVSFLEDEVSSITENSDSISVNTRENGSIKASYAFDSRLSDAGTTSNSILKQIFTGWRIKTETPFFDPKSLTLMEFPQRQSKQFDFFYILPYSENEALIEYTAYAKQPISEKDLTNSLSSYLKSLLGDSAYTITFEETGVIPMSTKLTETQKSERIISIGTRAGWTKASTGYTFHTIQRNCKQIVDSLSAGRLDKEIGQRSMRFSFYDNILLNIAQKWPEQLQGIFLNLFATSSADIVLRFLSEETSLKEEIGILAKLRFPIFIKSLLNYESH
jgi:lycopene beta-cyclase